MSVRQYIGARYVTKIYENTLDPSSAEWQASINYEPLTMVTYNNGSYLSKKQVPASVGDPAANPDYWVQTGFYNGQIADLQDKIDKINGAIYYPEMFGAAGDGIADDTSALAQCFGSNRTVILSGIYKITAPITISDIENMTILGGQIVRPYNELFNTLVCTNGSNITIIGTTFDGNGNVDRPDYVWRDSYQICCIFPRSRNILLSNCTIKNHKYALAFNLAHEGGVDETYCGKVDNCLFVNCDHGIDTYGKDLEIVNSTFDTVLKPIQIEPVGTPSDTDPLAASDYTMSAVRTLIQNNIIVHCPGLAIDIFRNSYGVVVSGNYIIDCAAGLLVRACKNVVVENNFFLEQRPDADITVDTRPWGDHGHNMIVESDYAIVRNNTFKHCYISMKITADKCMVDGNYFVEPLWSSIVLQNSDDTSLINNVISGYTQSADYWWGSRSIVLATSVRAFVINNKIDSDSSPIYSDASSTLYAKQNVTTTAQSDALYAYAPTLIET